MTGTGLLQVFTSNQEIKLINVNVKAYKSAYKSELSTGTIYKLYKCINNLSSHSTDYIKNKWEREVHFILIDED